MSWKGMAGSNAPTVIDVAQRAGVSTATVSRCLNAPLRVREATRLRVQAAIDDLGYTPNFAGQALASNRTHTIGAVIPTMENAIFARGLQALEEELADAGITLLVASSAYDPQREYNQIRALLRRGVDGLLLIGRERPPSTYELLARHPLPTVLAWTIGGDDLPMCVGFDNREGACAIADCVLAAGHRDIAMIAGRTAGNDRAADRIAGVRDALGAQGLTLPPHRLIEAAYTLEAGEQALACLIEQPSPPTAVLCGNDVLATGALRAARRLGLRVPEDISITGFDDIDLAEAVEPGLTTVHVPHRRMGRLAAQVLLRLRDRQPVETPHALKTWIVHRGSLAPPSTYRIRSAG